MQYGRVEKKMPSKYRKKPVVIEAMRYDGTAAGATPVIDWALSSGGTIRYECGDDDGCGGMAGVHFLAVETLEGKMLANGGDFIIRGVQGEFYPCKPDIVEATYEEAD